VKKLYATLQVANTLSEIRAKQAGDWQFEPHHNIIVTSLDVGDWKYNYLIMIHELIESLLCMVRGISEEEVTDFDVTFEAERDRGKHTPEDEAGDDPRAPYRKEHAFATAIERLIARELNVDWLEYEQAVLAKL
jgi:hypothetical protein